MRYWNVDIPMFVQWWILFVTPSLWKSSFESNFHMAESSPSAQPEELRRRILFVLQDKNKQGDYQYLFHAATSAIPKTSRELPQASSW
tara:strand:- start:34 stop:297 length:264 start_codon:yes stop_codon:yes gene_type:complete